VPQSCIFCKIISKEIPSTIVFESEKTLAILDIHPLRDGHTVVLPKLHKELVKDLPSDFAQDLGLTISKVSDILHASLNTDSNTIGINDGSGAGQGRL
jgi:diadenosine tetraphosphate (Ap4A) HIT family hydrolase